MDGWMDEYTDDQINGWMIMDERMMTDEWMDTEKRGWMMIDEWMDG